jgi:hypothetical protein
MPLMVDPSSGSLIYGQDVSVYTYDLPTATASESPATALATATTTFAHVVVTASAATVSKGVNMTAALAEQAAIQSGLDSE